jgi:hypothetical protein
MPATTPPAAAVLTLPIPPGVTAAELLDDLVRMAADAIAYRTPDTAEYCADCDKTEKNGFVTEVIFCPDHADDHELAAIYTGVHQQLTWVQAGKL